MSVPLQFASLYDGQEVFVWSDCLIDLGTDFLVGNVVFIYYIVLYPFVVVVVVFHLYRFGLGNVSTCRAFSLVVFDLA